MTNSKSFYAPEIEDRGAYCFCSVCHSLIINAVQSLCNSVWNFNLAHNFLTMRARALIFKYSLRQDLSVGTNPVILTFEFDLFFEIFDLT